MAVATIFAAGGLTVLDYRCECRVGAAPFAEQHEQASLSLVLRGTFGYEANGARHELVAGSLLLGHRGDEYRCSHDHGAGDECLSFQFEPDAEATLELTAAPWRLGAVPPMQSTAVLGELARHAAAGRAAVGLDEVGLLLVRELARLRSGRRRTTGRLSPADRRRAVDAAAWIEANCGEPIDLAAAAAHVGLSAFHFLRLFGRVVGATPHQHLVRSRLRRAADLLADGDRAVTTVAFECGFGDLSNFVRTFHRAAGVAPRAFQKLARGDRKILQARLSRFA